MESSSIQDTLKGPFLAFGESFNAKTHPASNIANTNTESSFSQQKPTSVDTNVYINRLELELNENRIVSNQVMTSSHQDFNNNTSSQMNQFDFNPLVQCSKLKSIVINENHTESVAVSAKNSHDETNRAQVPTQYKPRESFGGQTDRDLINNSNASNNSNSSSRLMMYAAPFDTNADQGVTRININHFNSSNHVFDKIKEVNQRAKKLEEQRQHSLKEIQTNSKSNLHSNFNNAMNRMDNQQPNSNNNNNTNSQNQQQEVNYLHQTEMVTFASSNKKDNSTSPIRIVKSKYYDDESGSEMDDKINNNEPNVAPKNNKSKQTQAECAKSAHDNFGYDKRFDDASAEGNSTSIKV